MDPDSSIIEILAPSDAASEQVIASFTAGARSPRRAGPGVQNFLTGGRRRLRGPEAQPLSPMTDFIPYVGRSIVHVDHEGRDVPRTR